MKRDNLINKKVSIIVPVYNVEGYIEECLSSLCEQTYTNIEIIVVDDGSTDRSGNICDMYSQKDQRIVVYHKENGGLSSARNYGLLYIKGEYVTFIDSDDYLNSNAIEIMLSNLINNEADVVECCFVDKKSKLKDKVIYFNDVEEAMKALKEREGVIQ